MPSIAIKSARLDARITPELQEQLQRIAKMQGRSLSEYVINTLRAAVQRDAVEIEVIHLNREESERVAMALIDPPPLSPAMIRAFEDHRNLIGQV